MTLRFKIFLRETPNWQEGNRQVWLGNIHNCAESSDITTCMWIQLCIGHSGVYRGHYREVKSRLFVSLGDVLDIRKVCQLLGRCDGHGADVRMLWVG